MAKEKEAPKEAPKSELQAAWEAFLATARAQREKDGTLHIFEAQEARGEFKDIPESFSVNQSIRVAPK
jgi:hypothetical protein